MKLCVDVVETAVDKLLNEEAAADDINFSQLCALPELSVQLQV